jgi:uncharacterized protein (DUF2344 family)
MLTWWAFFDSNQKLPSIETAFDIEHIFAKNRQENEKTLKNNKSIELLGNKTLLETRINIRASDYRFIDKTKYYQGFTNSKGKEKEGTQIYELIEISKKLKDFTEKDIDERNKKILEGFFEFLNINNLLKGN